MLVDGLTSALPRLTAAQRFHNADVLNQAKQALIAYVALQAAQLNENNPGHFPCPEAPGYVGVAGSEGIAAGFCSATPAIGRLPWRTLGIDRLHDATGEPLWYVLSSSWKRPNSTASLVINSNTDGELRVDGAANDAIALIIAPGRPLAVPACGGNPARNQSRGVPTSSINPLDYLECYDTATSSFATYGTPSNDQVVKITPADVLPSLEAAIAHRFERQIAPLMKSVSMAWGGGGSVFPFPAPMSDPTISPGEKLQGATVISSGTAAVTSGSTTISLSTAITPSVKDRYFRVQGSANAFRISTHSAGSNTLTLSSPFSGTSSGAASYHIFVSGGLLPASYSYTNSCSCGPAPCICSTTPTVCTPGASVPRCDPSFVRWRTPATITRTGGASLHASSQCNTVTGNPTTLHCELNAHMTLLQLLAGTNWVTFNVDATADNVGMTWRRVVTPSVAAPAINGIDTAYRNSPVGYGIDSANLNGDGSATVRVDARINITNGTTTTLGGITCEVFGIPLCYRTNISIPMALIEDHPLVQPANPDTDWFFRNKWHEVSYYAVAPNITPTGPRSCASGSTCIEVVHHQDSGKQRAILIFGGRKLEAQTRPAASVADLLEGSNADGASPFQVRSATLLPNRTFNDRFSVIDAN